MGRLWAHSPPDPGGVGWYYCLHGAEHLPRAGGLNFSRDERLRLRVCSRATGYPALSADPGYGFLSHISYVSGAYETYPSSNASRLREGFQRRYEELCRTEFDAASPAPRL